MADTAALVLALEARFDKFEKQMRDMGNAVDRQAKNLEDKMNHAAQAVVDKLSTIGTGFVSNIGLIGTVLSRLGPIGFGAAVGLGAAKAALDELLAMAQKLSETAIARKEFSVETGLPLQEVIALSKALAGLGIPLEEIQPALTKFFAALSEARRAGTGPLVDALRVMDQSFLRAIVNAKDGTEAITAFANALKQVRGAQGVEIARDVSGKTGTVFLRIAEDLPAFNKQIAEASKNAAGAADFTERLVAANRELTKASNELSAAWRALWGETALRAVKDQTEATLQLARAMAILGGAGRKEGESVAAFILRQSNLNRAIKDMTGKPLFGEPTDIDAQANKVVNAENRVKEGAEAVEEQLRKTGVVQQTVSKEALMAREAQRKADLDHVELLERMKKAQGAAFSPRDDLELQLRKARLAATAVSPQTGADVKREQADTLAAQEKLKEMYQATTVAIKERLGVATEAQIKAVALADVERQITEGRISALDREKATTIALREAREKYEQMLVKSSSTPQLQRAFLDLQNATKQFDQTATAALSNVSSNIADAILGTKTWQKAWEDMAKSIAKMLLEIAIKQAILAPFGPAGFGLLGGRQGGGPVKAGQPVVVGESGREIFIPSQSGKVIPLPNANPATSNSNVNIGGTSVVINGDVGDDQMVELKRVLAQHEVRIAATQRAIVSTQRFQSTGVH